MPYRYTRPLELLLMARLHGPGHDAYSEMMTYAQFVAVPRRGKYRSPLQKQDIICRLLRRAGQTIPHDRVARIQRALAHTVTAPI